MSMDLSEEDQLFVDVTRKWVDKECPKDWCRHLEQQEHVFPHELWDKLVEFGAHGIGVPEEYGGQGGTILNQTLFAREFSRTAAGLSWVWGVTSFSGTKAINFCGSEAQKQEFLPRIASGELKTAMSFTEAGGGTDLLGGMRTRGDKVDGGWLLNGEKIWSTGADVADYLLVMARTDMHAARRSDGISIFFVPRNSKGITITPLSKLGMRAMSSCSVLMEDVFVADELLLGEPNRGWYQSTKTLNNERLVNAATCLGMLDGVIEDAVAHMKSRHAFGQPIGQFQILQHYLADMAMWQKQGELMVLHTARLQAEDKPSAIESGMAKVLCSDYVSKAADLGIQILGGMGYSAETDMQRYWRDSRLLRLGPISNEMAKNMIAESYGMPRSF
ncbi:acyl-CoA dehydrogenase family protein [Haliea sp. E1-2-M8]|uniref:acyl-CoA dehydrogenase family protein n=1 Tax=Haliea sp. E1-2-M8 TaxID=3064706 RepID=UPI002715A45D|nr:acyl-CoA dehydrogenase family protein [Haliea sp. E1-2-M8]MDO8862924.1 acyl-CoA dehydrogenase family protein [Haliea sp. E1-2-M8]